jgi:hypothetical protein
MGYCTIFGISMQGINHHAAKWAIRTPQSQIMPVMPIADVMRKAASGQADGSPV